MEDAALFDMMATFLADPATHDGAETRRIDTHTAAVVLAGERAFKLRCPVDYGWLDYSTREKRRAAALREIEDNARGAPGLYIGLGGIADAPGSFEMLPPGSAGEDAEPLVVMHRFNDADLFDRMAAAGRLDEKLMHRTGRAIADMHRAAPKVPGGGRLPDFARREVNDLTALGDLLDNALIGQLAPLIRARADALAALAEARPRLHCHGDLHLRNIVLWQGVPAPFDCIDFNDAFTDIDPLYDLAFLLMDLDHRGHGELGPACFNAWAERMSDEPAPRTAIAYDGLALLPFYKACRAAIRGKVTGMAARTATGDVQDPEIAEANAYLRLALKYLTRPVMPRLIAVGGLSGSGKSTVARAIAAATGAVVLRSDAIRKGFWQADETDRLPPEAYAAEVSARVYDEMLDRAGRALEGGATVLLDAAHLRAHERARAKALAAERGIPFHGLWLDAEIDVMRERVTRREGDVSDADARIVALQAEYELGEITWHRLASGAPAATVCERALALIGTSAGEERTKEK